MSLDVSGKEKYFGLASFGLYSCMVTRAPNRYSISDTVIAGILQRTAQVNGGKISLFLASCECVNKHEQCNYFSQAM